MRRLLLSPTSLFSQPSVHGPEGRNLDSWKNIKAAKLYVTVNGTCRSTLSVLKVLTKLEEF